MTADDEKGPADADLASPLAPAVVLTFDAVYDAWFDEVSRWIRALGGLDSELDDLTQEVFIVVGRKLAGFDGRNLGGWLYRIASQTLSDHRRRSWWKRLFQRTDNTVLERLPMGGVGGGDPEALLSRKQARGALYQVLDQMSEKRRTAFILFEIEGHSGEEIARLLDVEEATVWTRLHRARADFYRLVQERLHKENA